MTNIEHIERDLRPFADPATDITAKATDTVARIEIIRNGDSHDYHIDLKSGRLTARHDGNRAFVGLGSLLASGGFADIKSMAETQQRLHRDFDPTDLIPPEGLLNDSRLKLDNIRASLTPRTEAKAEPKGPLRILLLDGPAGVGKTSLIETIVVDRARNYGKESSSPPILHVSSRGRRLAGLNDALAQSIQLIRAKYTFDQVPVLIRYGLLQVAIDGFDELVDPEGYRDAWFALRDFFNDVESGGPIILAGRDTFFDEQSFAERLKSFGHHFELHHARLQPVRPSSAKEWLRKKGWAEDELKKPETDEILREGSYALRPYFLSVLGKATGWSELESMDATPRAFLVDKFLTREASLVANSLPLDIVVTRDKLHRLFSEVALEMADNETETVDIAFLQLATEITFGDLVDPKDLAKLRHKAGSLALLESDAREDHRRFPHTEISHHFLASALIETIREGNCPRVLRRGLLGIDFLLVFEEVFERLNTADARDFIGTLDRLRNREASFDRLDENVGALSLATLSRSLDGAVRRYEGFNLNEAAVSGVPIGHLQGIKITRFEIRQTDLTNVVFDDCEISTSIVDDTTRFGKTVPVIHQLQLRSKSEVKAIYDPAEIKSWIINHSTDQENLDATGSINSAAIQLLGRVSRIMLHQYYIKDDPDDTFGTHLQNPLWPKIEEILTQANQIRRTDRLPASGRRASYIHILGVDALLQQAPQDEVSSRIWRAVAAIPSA